MWRSEKVTQLVVLLLPVFTSKINTQTHNVVILIKLKLMCVFVKQKYILTCVFCCIFVILRLIQFTALNVPFKMLFFCSPESQKEQNCGFERHPGQIQRSRLLWKFLSH